MGIGVFCDILVVLVDYRNSMNLVSICSQGIFEAYLRIP